MIIQEVFEKSIDWNQLSLDESLHYNSVLNSVKNQNFQGPNNCLEIKKKFKFLEEKNAQLKQEIRKKYS